MDWQSFFTILHLIGVALGAGGAYMSDFIFLTSTRDGFISKTELKFLRLGSRVVWVGLLILAISGLLLFSLSPADYLASSKFLAKVTIVAIIFINGLIFHFSHIERIKRHVGEHFPSSDEFMRRRPILLTNGAISVVSWTSALILGALKTVPYSYLFIMSLYLIAAIIAILVSLLIFRKNSSL